MLLRVLETIENKKMLKAGDKVVCAVSGGADSMALLCVLYELREKLGIELYAANVNHSIRGEEGDRDSEFVRDFCKEKGIELFYKKLDIPRIAKEEQISEEECGRRERYCFFDEITKKLGGAHIATGHHRGDNAETVLFNLFRGSGLKGLSGIPYKRDNIIRPLLDVSKDEIKSYLTKKNITWCEDSTNKECDYTRNKMRNIVLFEAEKIFPKAEEKISAVSQMLRQDDEYLNELATKSGAFEDGVILKDEFVKLPESLRRRVVAEALNRWQVREIDTKKIKAVYDIILGGTGKGVDLGSNIRIVQSYGKIYKTEKKPSENHGEKYIFKNGENLEISTSDGVWSIKTVDKTVKMRDNKMMTFFDAELLPESLVIRGREEGDFMYPYGMDGKKKIKKIFIDLKIRKEIRDKILMLANNDEILFIPGVRKSAKYQPSEKTKKFLYVEFCKQNGK
ncbi:MAG: tRNA lysidine(34) synthetase TilS [Clostridia bacterium]|nr:tRNA lysidine(34) synthetase TilS [Clostridia bacterium]